MRKKLAILLILIAIGIGLFPFLSRFLLKQQANSDISSFYKIKLSKDDIDKTKQEKEKYNNMLLAGAFNTDGELVELDLPEELLSSGKKLKPISILYIPKLEEQIRLYLGVDDNVLSLGAGILKNTSIPGTRNSNSVISGHRGTHNANIFRHLDKVKNGDVFFILDKTEPEPLKYSVVAIDVVLPNEVDKLKVKKGKEIVTLLTCTPFLINTERLLVFGERVPLTEEDKQMLIDKFSNTNSLFNINLTYEQIQMVSIAILVVMLLIIYLVILYILKRKDKKEVYYEVGFGTEEWYKEH